MFGKITYQGEADYVERLLADEAGVMLTVCTSFDQVKLYRLDYTIDGYPTNVAVYDIVEAINQFQRIVEKQHQVPDRKFHAGQRVYFSNITHDEFDRPITSPKAALKVLELAEQGIDRYDYKVVSIKTGNIFYVKEDELQTSATTPAALPDQEPKSFTYVSEDDNQLHQARRIDWDNLLD